MSTATATASVVGIRVTEVILLLLLAVPTFYGVNLTPVHPGWLDLLFLVQYSLAALGAWLAGERFVRSIR